MGLRVRLCAASAAVVLALSGCGGDHSATSTRSLDDYVKAECAMLADFRDQFQKLVHDFVANIRNQPAMADTVSAMGDLYQGMITKTDELGDPPNGEGVGGDAEARAAVESASAQFHDIASSIRAAKTDTEIQAAIARVQHLSEQMVKQGADLKKKYPTPEIDKAKQAVPGCSDSPGA
jgi:hypothetical protein